MLIVEEGFWSRVAVWEADTLPLSYARSNRMCRKSNEGIDRCQIGAVGFEVRFFGLWTLAFGL